MNDTSPGGVKATLQDPLRSASATAVTALVTGLTGAFLAGAWRTAFLAACGLALMTLLAVLIAAGSWHSHEIEEADYERARDQDAEQRRLTKHERDHRSLITLASTAAGDAVEQKANVTSLLEQLRKHISRGRSSPVELLFVDDTHNADAPELVACAGRFDLSVLGDPHELGDWIDSLGACAYPARIRVLAKSYRVLGVADTPMGTHDQAEIQRAATKMQGLLVAHIAAAATDDQVGEA